jgi:hypothetical protein
MYELRIDGEFHAVHGSEEVLKNEVARFTAGWDPEIKGPRAAKRGPNGEALRDEKGNLTGANDDLSYDPARFAVTPIKPCHVLRRGCIVDTADTPNEAHERRAAAIERDANRGENQRRYARLAMAGLPDEAAVLAWLEGFRAPRDGSEPSPFGPEIDDRLRETVRRIMGPAYTLHIPPELASAERTGDDATERGPEASASDADEPTEGEKSPW